MTAVCHGLLAGGLFLGLFLGLERLLARRATRMRRAAERSLAGVTRRLETHTHVKGAAAVGGKDVGGADVRRG